MKFTIQVKYYEKYFYIVENVYCNKLIGEECYYINAIGNFF